MTSPITPYPIKRIKGVRYYRVPQSQHIAADGGVYKADDACKGCAFNVENREEACKEHNDPKLVYQPVLCQDYEYKLDTYTEGKYEDYNVLKDYIFIPANRKGIAAYIAHLLEAA